MSYFKKLINASDLIEWIMETNPDWCVGAVWSIVDHVEELPSATCDDCIWQVCNYNKVDWNGENDYISRQAAIAVADSSDYVGLSVEDAKKVTDEVVKGLKRLPSEQPEIILCKDCRYAAPNGVYGCRLERFSMHDNDERLYADDFCSRAERGTNEEEE